MTREEIIQLARECGMWGEIEHYSHGVMLSELIRFTRLVQAWENEACAAIAYEYGTWNQTAQDIGDEIRNRYAVKPTKTLQQTEELS
jgi:hypothetical protein